MAQSQARQVRVRSNESTLDEIAGYWVKLYSVPRNAAALTEDGLVQCNIKWHSVGWNYFEYIQTVQGRGKLENFEKFNEVHENENISEIMENCMNWFSIKLDLGGASVRWSWNHKKYKRWVEQLRVNRDRVWHPHWKILASNIGELIQSSWSASKLFYSIVSSLSYSSLFISFHNAL